ncbi:PqqD family peptide modification chaperone [Nocardioides sp.]|uniref:PqqD family peptide modification chaperone n=1 Tax=Nocardioides sp. TaxID=35761 RepID=UPI0035119635
MSLPLSSDVPLRRRADLHTQELDGDLVMADLAAGNYFGLGDVARVVWERLAEPASLDTLVTELTARYDVDAETCRREVGDFLGSLHQHGLLVTD